MSHLGSFFRNRRLEKGLSLGQVACLLGYKNRSRGANRIQSLESGGRVRPEFLGQLAEVLGVGPDEIRQRAYEDYKDWLAWASEPVTPHVVVRILPAIYQRVPLPDNALGPEAAEAFAAGVARERRMRVCLVRSRRVSVWYGAEGKETGRLEATLEWPGAPCTVIGGKRVQFDFGGGVGPKPIDEPAI
jgi:transcriptional regulator with XRE-family HTH domain